MMAPPVLDVSPLRSRLRVDVPPRVKAPLKLSKSLLRPPVLDPAIWIVRLPELLKSAEIPLSVPRVVIGSPGLTRPPATMIGPVVPIPPRAAPALTVMVLPVYRPSISSVPALTVVGPVEELLAV